MRDAQVTNFGISISVDIVEQAMCAVLYKMDFIETYVILYNLYERWYDFDSMREEDEHTGYRVGIGTS